jgi:hypothetical protein
MRNTHTHKGKKCQTMQAFLLHFLPRGENYTFMLRFTDFVVAKEESWSLHGQHSTPPRTRGTGGSSHCLFFSRSGLQLEYHVIFLPSFFFVS